ncbi:DNA-binding protein WhiA [Peptoniphilus genitalis]|uniref:Probable cell division protein WhiA n=1 Tax=Peptoniphilus genitalis TaxID=3036303 RepID=A0ABY4TLG8_9FIRM|nr:MULTISPECIES: DNA-binding protein WhiA [unclassified Peptoniphilus]URN41020.1 DNA-binding protein WhiA [Peptoniphilus sp. SAHP1]
MSFSSEIKDEVAKIKVEDYKIILSELAGITPMCGILNFKNNKISMEYITENAPVARRIFTFLRRSFGFDVEVKNVRSTQLKKNVFIIYISQDESCRLLLDELKYIKGASVFMINYAPTDLIKTSNEKKAYIRGAFMGSGSITDPKKGYHLEFVSENESNAYFLRDTINEFGLKSKVIMRKEKYIIYIKDSEQISDFLSLIGAYNSVLNYENVRVIKEMRNNVNRIVNCETANLNKTVKSSYDQVEDIKLIEMEIGIENLDEDLKAIAKIRLENRSMSLNDIANSLEPKLSKSTVNYRFKKLRRIANKLRGV